MWTSREESQSDSQDARRQVRALAAELAQGMQRDVRLAVAELEEQATCCGGAQASMALEACEQSTLRLRALLRSLDDLT